MNLWSRWRRASACLAALLLPAGGIAATPAPVPAAAPGALVLAVELDGKAADEAVLVRRSGGDLLVDAADLRRLGLPVAPETYGPVPLASIAGLSATVDDARQVLVLTRAQAGPARLRLRPATSAGDAPTSRSWGGYLNYEATATRDPAGFGAAADLEAVAFGPRGYAFAGAIAHAGPGGGGVERTDIGYTYDDPARLVSATLGDSITSASSQSRPVRFSGLRVGTDFALRPDLVTFPLTAIGGTATAPTAVDVLVNGQQQAAGDVKAGQFTVSDIPVQTGVNTISVATHDALGRATVQTVTTYASRTLLTPGLVAWSGEAGWVRTGYLTPYDRYRAFAASGTVRVGVADTLTLEGHGEASGRSVDEAVGASLSLGRLGLLTGSAAVSMDADRKSAGTQLAAAIERIARPVSFTARYLAQTSGWSDLAARYGAPTPSHELLLNIGFDLKRLGTLGANLIAFGASDTRFDPRGRLLPVPLHTPGSTLLVGSYNARLGRRLGFVANVAADTRRRGSLFASIGLLVLLDARASAYAGVQHQAGSTGATASVTRSAIEQGQWGYRLAGAAGPVDQASAAVQYLGRAGEAEAAVQIVDGRAAAQLSARGAVGVAGGHPFVADTMTSSFAVIETQGAAGTPIYQDHRRIGTTNAAGVLVAPNLPSLERVSFSIDPADLPVEAGLDHAETAVAIPRRSGAVLAFDLRPTRAVLMALVDERGDALPAGSRALIGDASYPVGIGGLVYAELPPGTDGFGVEGDGKRRCVVGPHPARPSGTAPLRVACPAMVATAAR